MTTRKLNLKTETLMTLTSALLDRVRGGAGELPCIRDSDLCPPVKASESGPATCVVWPKGSNRF